jgi:hypothetical protein
VAVSKQCSGSHIGFRLSDALAPGLLRFSLKFSKYLICLKNFPGPPIAKYLTCHKKIWAPRRSPKVYLKFLKYYLIKFCRIMLVRPLEFQNVVVPVLFVFLLDL